MNRFILGFVVLGLGLAQHQAAHTQTLRISVTDSDFFAGRNAPAPRLSDDTPMRIVPAAIGRPDPAFRAAHGQFDVPRGLLVPPVTNGVVATPPTVADAAGD